MAHKNNYVNKNYYALYQEIRKRAENPTQYSILMLVADYINSKNNFHQKYKTLAKNIKVSQRTIEREVPILIKLGFLSVMVKATKTSPHVLRLGDCFIDVFEEKSAPPNCRVSTAKLSGLEPPNWRTNVLTEFNYINDDKASPSPPIGIGKTAEKAVIKKETTLVSSRELCDLMKSLIPKKQDGSLVYIPFGRFKGLKITQQEAYDITDAARARKMWLSPTDFCTPKAAQDTIANLIRIRNGNVAPFVPIQTPKEEPTPKLEVASTEAAEKFFNTYFKRK